MKSLTQYIKESSINEVGEELKAAKWDDISLCIMMAESLGMDLKSDWDKVFKAICETVGLIPICKLYNITSTGEDRKKEAMDKIMTQWKTKH